ncbi:cupin domain-containing protein [Inquilinus limosus]|uniref:Cupin n=1 Tax=Inquilinus limosus MP06 TaxID=1398085 RepID=A0A0A0DB77_9PROT|nr:cupin domain-containing protein [Inquilinus limosus]KGM35173.1 cupin [Inquilinus limosus MP06]
MSAETRPGNPGEMTIRRAGSAITCAPDGIASGPFWVEGLLDGRLDGEMTAMRATLDPGIRTRWHSHPLGQLLYVLQGVGLVQRAGGPVTEVRAGDSIWFAPDERHWHGASADSVFAYVSVQPVRAGTAVHWMEPV